MIFGAIRKHLGEVFHYLARQKGVIIEEGHLMPDHVHMLLLLLKVKVRFQLLEYLKVSKGILMVKHFGLEGILYQQLVLMKIW